MQQEDYDNYFERIVNLFVTANSKSSSMFDLKINGNDAVMNMSIIDQQSGEKKELLNVSFKTDGNLFDSFIQRVVSEVYNNIKVSVSDIVNLDGDDYYAFRMVTEKYDLFVIDGLEKEKAQKLLAGLNKEKEDKGNQEVLNNNGAGNILLFFIMVSTLIISFISVVVFLG